MTIADKLKQITENIPKAYEAGKAEGHTEGYEIGKAEGYAEGHTAGYEIGKAEGIDQGKQAEYDAFWDVYQRNGVGFSYFYMFSGGGWKDAIYNPKYPIRVLYNANYMYFNSPITDTKVPIDISGLTGNNVYMFGNSKIETISLLIVDEITAFASSMFNECTNLINLTISGVIAKSGLNLQWSTKLSRASIESIIAALEEGEFDENWSSLRPATSITLSLAAVNKAFETSEGANDGADNYEFIGLLATPRTHNWTINLV